jgi:hypothetical protein
MRSDLPQWVGQCPPLHAPANVESIAAPNVRVVPALATSACTCKREIASEDTRADAYMGRNRSRTEEVRPPLPRLVMADVDIRTVAELMGHKSIQMTMGYALLAPEHKLVAVERLAGYNS